MCNRLNINMFRLQCCLSNISNNTCLVSLAIPGMALCVPFTCPVMATMVLLSKEYTLKERMPYTVQCAQQRSSFIDD